MRSVPQELGSYHLKERLAVGGQSEVWLALRTGPGGFRRRCAVKLLLPPESFEAGPRKAFIAEARLMALFDHANLLEVTDIIDDEENAVVGAVMPYVSGISLATAQRRNQRPFGFRESLWIMSRVYLALHYAHTLADERGKPLGIIHRDLSPENIMLSFGGSVKLIDFGIAISNIVTRSTRIHVVKGKLDYLSPEQANSSQVIDHKTDIYSAGLILYHLITGVNPLEGDPETALARARNPSIEPMSHYIKIPEELDHAMRAVLAPDPEARPHSGLQVARLLLSVLRALDPMFDEIVFEERLKDKFRNEMKLEADFLRNLADGTQIIDASDLKSAPGTRQRQVTPILPLDAEEPLELEDLPE